MAATNKSCLPLSARETPLNWDDEEDNQKPAAGAEDDDVMPALDDGDDENT